MKAAVSFWKEYRLILLLFFLLFSASLLLGFFYANAFPHYGEITKQFAEGKEPTFIDLIRNNLLSAFVNMVGGVLFILLPLFFLFQNGSLLGYLLHEAAGRGINPVQAFITGILPHGIFEIPAILLVNAYTFILWIYLFKSILRLFRSRKDSIGWKKYFHSTPLTFAVILFLFLMAALVEAYLTPLLMDHFLNLELPQLSQHR